MVKILLLAIFALSIGAEGRNIESRIVGGETVEAMQVPYIVSIRPAGSTQHICGGSLISTTWVVSSAQYLQNRDNNSLSLVVGIVDLTATVPQPRTSIAIIINPSFVPSTRINDIALVQMNTAVTFNPQVSSIFMHSFWVGPQVDSRVSGWGATNPNGGGNSQFLRQLAVQTIACPTSAPGTEPQTNANSICATANPTTSGICTTDVGGPLITVDGLIGVASWHSMPCGTAANPDVYIRISSFRNWIRSITNV